MQDNYASSQHMSIQRQQGVALLSVLVTSMILILLVASASTLMERRLEIAQTSINQLKQKAAVYKKQQELTYLITTQRITFAGVSRGINKAGLTKIDGMWTTSLVGDEIRADGFINKETVDGQPISFSIQADNGLMPVNTSDRFWQHLWLSANGISYSDVSLYLDPLSDYADSDQWSGAAGAEAPTYLKENLPAPPNYLLQSCTELNNIYRWSNLLKNKPGMVSECSLSRNASVNINAVPLSLWAKMWPNSLENVTQNRERGIWFMNETDALGIESGFIRTPPAYLAYIGHNHFKVHVESKSVTSEVRIVNQKGSLAPFRAYFVPSQIF